MYSVILFFDKLSPFWQGIAGSAAFAAATIIFQASRRLLGRIAGKFGGAMLESYSYNLLFKHWVYKEYATSTAISALSQGNFFIIRKVFHWTLQGILFLIFFFGVASILNREWLHCLGHYFAFNCFLEGYLWTKDTSDEVNIQKIDENIKTKFFTSIGKTSRTVTTQAPTPRIDTEVK